MIEKILHSITNTAGMTTYRIGLLQTKAYRILNHVTAKALKEYEITPVDWAMLGLLFEHPDGLRLSDLAEELGVEAPFITERTQELINQNLVTISTTKEDKRVKCMALTAKAKRKIPIIEQVLLKAMKPLLSGSSIKEVLSYKNVLELIVANKPKKE